MNTSPTEIPFQQVIDALLDIDTPFNPRFLQRFSDLDNKELSLLKGVWNNVPAWRRKALLEDIEQLGEDDTLVSFEALGRLALEDADPEVRLPALRTLWEYETIDLLPSYIQMMKADPSVPVRAASASTLGRFVYMGELEEIPETTLHQIEEELLATINSQDDELVRRRALEAIGYSSRDEVPALIEKGFHSRDKEWIASALYAMGRSANQQWRPQVLEMLDSQHPVIRAEAARAAGELELTAAVPRLVDLLEDSDEETREASIWSLSQLGGEGVRKKLERLYEESDDEEERTLIESALDNLTFNEDMQLLPILDISTEIEDDGEELDDDYFISGFDEEDSYELDEPADEEADWLEDEDDVEDLD